MEAPVWMRLFAQVATNLSSLLSSLTGARKPESLISSSDVQGNDVASTSTSKIIPANVPLLSIKRDPTKTTNDGVFGVMAFNRQFLGYTVENKGKEISEGLYTATVDMSPRLGYECPHLKVPERDVLAGGDAGIRIHVANRPDQLEGCIAPGETQDGDALDHSQAAFDRMMAAVPYEFTVQVS